MFDFGFENTAWIREYRFANDLVIHSADDDVLNMAWVDFNLVVSPCYYKRI